jgi:hypothetical protein
MAARQRLIRETKPLDKPIHRLTFRDGMWAEVQTEGITNRQNRAIVAAAEAADRGTRSFVDWAQECGRQLCRAWSVRTEKGDLQLRDELGNLDEDGWDEAPGEVIDAICQVAQQAWGDWRRSARPFPESA